MPVKNIDFDSISAGDYAVRDTTAYCPANVGPNDWTYQPCGAKMRKYQNGKTICPTHGEMY